MRSSDIIYFTEFCEFVYNVCDYHLEMYRVWFTRCTEVVLDAEDPRLVTTLPVIFTRYVFMGVFLPKKYMTKKLYEQTKGIARHLT